MEFVSRIVGRIRSTIDQVLGRDNAVVETIIAAPVHSGNESASEALSANAVSTSKTPNELPAKKPRRLRSFPRAGEVRGIVRERSRADLAQRSTKCQIYKRSLLSKPVDENEWSKVLHRRLRSLVVRTGQMPARRDFENLALRVVCLSGASKEEKRKLRDVAQRVYRIYRDASIRGLMIAEIEARERDAKANAENRKYVDGTF